MLNEQIKLVKKLVVIALASDDELLESLVLKGGYALELTLENGFNRSSIDIDYSMESDFDDPKTIIKKISSLLEKTFRSNDLIIYDIKFGPKPSKLKEELEGFWGGYRLEFKVADLETFKNFKNDIVALRNRSLELGPNQKKIFKVDISKHEFINETNHTEV